MQRASQEDLGKCLSSLMRTGPSPVTSAGGKASKTWAPSSCAWNLKMDLAAAHDCLDASQRGSREAWGYTRKLPGPQQEGGVWHQAT